MKILSTFNRLFTLLFAVIVATSCTNQDALFGNGLVPPAQGMDTAIDSTLTVRTSIMAIDSVPTSKGKGVVYLGSTWNPTVGLTTSDVVTTYSSLGFNLEQTPKLFGKDAVLDSMFMLLSLTNVKGDTSQKLHISVHEVIDTMFTTKSIYYSSFVADKYYKAEPICEFDLSGGTRTLIEKLPRSYFEKLLFNEKDPHTNPYISGNDSLFLRLFKGLFFKVRPVTPPMQGAIYQITMSTSTLKLHYHNAEAKPDTTYMPYFFRLPDDNYGQAQGINVNFYTVKNEFNLADPSRGGIDYRLINDSTVTSKVNYVGGMVGLGARVEIDTVQLAALQQKVVAAGYRKIAIQRASIRWYVSDQSPETYKWIPTRMCLYYDFNKDKAVPDYDPLQESSSTSYQSDIGGYINRSNGYYEQVITSTIQRLINKTPGASSVVQLLPSVSDIVSYGYVSLGGPQSAPQSPTLVLVYTMLR